MRSYGPETVTISETATGTRRFYVHDFENRNSSTSRALAESGAEAAVYFGSGDPPRTFRVPDEAGTVWHVFNLDGDDGTVVPVDKITCQAYPGRIDFPEIVSSPLPAAVCGTRYVYQNAGRRSGLGPSCLRPCLRPRRHGPWIPRRDFWNGRREATRADGTTSKSGCPTADAARTRSFSR